MRPKVIQNESSLGPQYLHHVTCGQCLYEAVPILSARSAPWVLGVFWCPFCRAVQTIQPGNDRVIPAPTQLSLFPLGND